MYINRRNFLIAGGALTISGQCFGATASNTNPLLSGVNLSGGEYNAGSSRLYWDYVYPSTAEIDYYASKGFKALRIPILCDRMLLNQTSTTDASIIYNLILYAQKYSMKIIIDVHQFGYMDQGM